MPHLLLLYQCSWLARETPPLLVDLCNCMTKQQQQQQVLLRVQSQCMREPSSGASNRNVFTTITNACFSRCCVARQEQCVIKLRQHSLAHVVVRKGAP